MYRESITAVCLRGKAIGARAGGTALKKFGQLRFFGQQEKIGQSQFFKEVSTSFYYFEEVDIFYFNLISAW